MNRVQEIFEFVIAHCTALWCKAFEATRCVLQHHIKNFTLLLFFKIYIIISSEILFKLSCYNTLARLLHCKLITLCEYGFRVVWGCSYVVELPVLHVSLHVIIL